MPPVSKTTRRLRFHKLGIGCDHLKALPICGWDQAELLKLGRFPSAL